MLVFGPGKYKSQIRAYLRVLIRGNWIFGIIIGTIFFLIYLALLLFTHSPLTPTFLGLSIAGPFILFQWLMRRRVMLTAAPFSRHCGSRCMLMISFGSFGMYHYECLNPTTALFVLAIANLTSGLWLFFKLGVHHKMQRDCEVERDVRGRL